MEYTFHIYNKIAADGVSMAIDKLLKLRQNKKTQGAGMRTNARHPAVWGAAHAARVKDEKFC